MVAKMGDRQPPLNPMISIIHPSRSRPQQAFDTFKRWSETCDVTFEYILSIDFSDPCNMEYMELFFNTSAIVTCNHNKSAIDAINRAAEHTTQNLLIQISEDFYCFPGWGKTILEVTKDREDFLLKTNDGTQGWIVTLPIMDRKFYEANGYFYYPLYSHMFCDTDLTHKADIEKKLIIRNDITFEHRHYQTRKTQKDAVNEKNDRTWGQGQDLYLQRFREAFGTDKDVWDLSPQAAAHIRWIKQRLNAA